MIQLIKQLSGLLIVGITLVTACKSPEALPSNSTSLTVHQSARLASGVMVRVDSIQDSRCPADVNCIWAGQAKVVMLLSADEDSSRVALILDPAFSEGSKKRLDSTNVSLNKQAYKVILREVTPYPTTISQPKAQTAIVQVTKL